MQAMKCGQKNDRALHALAKLSSSFFSSDPILFGFFKTLFRENSHPSPRVASNDFTDKVAGKVESCKHDVSQ